MIIESKNLIVRNFTEQDVDVLYNIKYDKWVMEYIPTYLERNVTKEKIKEYISKFDQYCRKGYGSEAAAAFAERFCEVNGVDYLIAVMDVDNPASYNTALRSGFKLFEKRTVYDYTYNRYCDDYYYFRRYYSKSLVTNKFYGDTIYDGRHS